MWASLPGLHIEWKTTNIRTIDNPPDRMKRTLEKTEEHTSANPSHVQKFSDNEGPSKTNNDPHHIWKDATRAR